MTRIDARYYSGEMVSEIHLLSEKISQLAELAQSLRRENAELRLNLTAALAENAELSRRMAEAHQRVSALLEKIPVAEHNEETA